MNYDFTTIGALCGMAVAIFLIIKKVQPAYSLILGALVGGIIGSGNLVLTVDTMVSTRLPLPMIPPTKAPKIKL